MPKYKYLTKLWKSYYPDFVEIERVEIDKESEKSVWISGHRNAKRSEFHNYFDTAEEALDFLSKDIDRKLNIAREQVKILEAAKERATTLEV